MSNEFDYDSNPGTSQQNQQQVPENNTSGYYHSVGDPNGRAAENVQSSGYQNGYAAPNTNPQQGRAPRARPERPAAPKAIRHRSSRAAIMRTQAAAVPFLR